MEIENAYATAKGDALFGAVFTQLEVDSGKLTDDEKRFLRTYVPPYTTGTGDAMELAFMIPGQVLAEISDRPEFTKRFEEATQGWLKAHPWIGAQKAPKTRLDARLGKEYPSTDERKRDWKRVRRKKPRIVR